MAPQWIPQNLQKRLLLYVLQQLSLFSEIDLPNLDVSLGAQSQISLRDVKLDSEKISLPGIFLRDGQVGLLELRLTVTGGVNIDASDIELILAPAPLNNTNLHFSLVESTANLANSVMFPGDGDEFGSDSDGQSIVDSITESSQKSSSKESASTTNQEKGGSTLSGVMAKAAEMALARLQVNLKNIKIKIIADLSTIQIFIKEVSFKTDNGVRMAQIEGLEVTLLKPDISPGDLESANIHSHVRSEYRSNSNTNSESETSRSFPSSENDSDSEQDEDMMSSSILNQEKPLMDSVVFSHEEASSIYMSATSDVLKSKLGKANDSKPPILLYVDLICAKFEGLTTLSNLSIDVGEIKVAAVPLFPTLTALFGTAARLTKLSNIQKSNMKKQQQQRQEQGDLKEDESLDFDLFSKLQINSIVISLTSALFSDGVFACSKSINLHLTKLKIKRKDESLIYGGVESIQLIKDEKEVIFEFEDNSEPDDIKKKADVRFEVLKSEISETTVLCSKPGFLKLDSISLAAITKLFFGVNPVIASFNKIGFFTSSPDPFKHSKPSLLIIQTALLNVKLHLSNSEVLSTTVLPMSFNSIQGSLSMNKIFVSIYKNQAPEKLIVKLSDILLNLHSKKFKSFDMHAREVMLSSPTTLDLDSLKLNCSLDSLKELIESIKTFTKTFIKKHFSSKEDKEPQYMHSSKRKVRMGSTIFQNQRPISMRINLNQFSLEIPNVTSLFGSLVGNFSSIGINFFKEGDIQILVMNGWIGRHVLEVKEPFIEPANPEDKSSPIVSIRIRKSAVVEVGLKNLNFEYYTNWVPLFESNSNSDEKISSATNEKKIEKNETNTSSALEIRVTFTECVLGLNAHNLAAKGLLVFKKANADFIISNDILVKTDFRTINMLLIDDSAHVLSIDESRDRRNWLNMKRQDESIPTWSQVSWFISRGFVSVANINSFHADVIVRFPSTLKKLPDKEKSIVDIKLTSDVCKLSLCADSAQALIQLINDLKQPITVKNEYKYKPKVNTDINVFEDIDHNAFCFSSSDFKSNDSTTSKLNSNNNSNDSSLKFVDTFFESSGKSADSSNIATSKSSTTQEMNHQRNENNADSFLEQDLNNLEIGVSTFGDKTYIKKNPFYIDSSIHKTSNDESNSNIEFEDDHFEQQSLNTEQDEIKVFPLKLFLVANKISIDLFDGYDWKETRRTISSAVKRVEAQAVKEYQKSENDNSFEIFGTVPISQTRRRDSLGERGFIDHNDEWEDEDEDDNEFNYGNQIIGETIYDSIHVSIPVGMDPSNLTKSINRGLNDVDESEKSSLLNDAISETHGIELGKSYKKLKLKRSKFHKISIEITDVDVELIILNSIDPRKALPPKKSAQFDDDDSEILNSIDIRIRDLQVVDNVPSSTWNKFLGYMRNAGEREVGINMLHISLKTVRPNSLLCATEIIMNVQLLPLRLYVDQDTLDFLTRFGSFRDSRFLLPVLEDDDIIYIQKFNINSFKVKLDYKPKKVDYAGIRSGQTTEFMNFFILDEADMNMKSVTVYGVPGFPRLGKLLSSIWTPDIKSTQLGGVLAGLAPVRSIVNIGSGVKDLFAVPIKEYKKDGRIIRSLQKGVFSFAKTTSSEILKFGVKLANGTQAILETTEEALGGVGSAARIDGKFINTKVPIFYNREDEEFYAIIDDVHRKSKNKSKSQHSNMNSSQLIGKGSLSVESFSRRGFKSSLPVYLEDDEEDEEFLSKEEISSSMDNFESDEHQKTISLYADQPENIREGLTSAYNSFGKNLVTAQKAIFKAGATASESGSAQGTAIAIAKATPVVVIRPIIGATEAMSRALLGVTNYLDPEQRLNSQEKYKPVSKKS